MVHNVQTVRTKRPPKAEHLARHAITSVPASDREVWSARDIQHRWNISEVTFWRYRKKGYVPAPDAKIGPRPAWYRETVLAAERARADAAATP